MITLLLGVLVQAESLSTRAGPRALKLVNDEIRLARSAAPTSVSARARVLILTDTGYAVAVEGTSPVSYYHLRFRLDPAANTLAGAVTITLRSRVSAPGGVSFDMGSNLIADSVTSGHSHPRFTHRGEVLNLALAPSGATSVTVHYHARLDSALTIGQVDGSPTIASYGLPYTAQRWWPCIDRPSAKADSVDIDMTVPQPLTAASNGRLRQRLDGPDGTTTFRWSVRYPIYPDVVSIAAARYVVRDRYYRFSTGDSMPLTFYLFEGDTAKASVDLSVLPGILDAYAVILGAYPFPREKYGVAEFTIRSFREHQTIPSYGAAFLTGDHRNDWILAHELAHQWFGNMVTVASWSHAWLNESFATYASALWREHAGGRASYKDAMAQMLTGNLDGPLYVADSTDVDHMFTAVTFRRGAWVLHMLRHVMRDSTFFGALHAYLHANAYRTATTDDFQRACEAALGSDLSWFFREWVYRGGLPKYELRVEASAPGDSSSVLSVRQTQADSLWFRMPLDVLLHTDRGDTTIVVWDSLPEQRLVVTGPARITAAVLDPEHWVLQRP